MNANNAFRAATWLVVIGLVVLLLQDAWVKNRCLHPAKDYEAEPKVVFACQKTSWMAVLSGAF